MNNHPVPGFAVADLLVLHLEDSPQDAELIQHRLSSLPIPVQVDWAGDEDQFCAYLEASSSHPYDVVLADYQLPGFDAQAALGLVRSRSKELPFVCVSGAIGEERAIDLLRLGATDFVSKSHLEKLPLAIERALSEVGSRRAQRATESALHLSEDQNHLDRADFEQAFGASPIGMALVGLDGRFLRINRSFWTIVGWSESELMAKEFVDFTHPDDFNNDVELLEQLKRGQIPSFQVEKRYFHRDGHEIWVQINVSLVRSASGPPLHLVSQIQDITERKKTENDLHEVAQNIARREFETLSVLGRAAEFRDPETANHIVRVALVSRLIARSLGLSEDQQESILHAAPLHDVGKLGIPDALLLKPGPLNEEEFALMKTHTDIGFHILKSSIGRYLQVGAEIALTHHEKYDGNGYPRRLAGEQIPLFGRIVALADAFDAMSSRRPYKEPWPVESVSAVLREQRGRHFDPVVVDAFFAVLDPVLELYEQYRD